MVAEESPIVVFAKQLAARGVTSLEGLSKAAVQECARNMPPLVATKTPTTDTQSDTTDSAPPENGNKVSFILLIDLQFQLVSLTFFWKAGGQ